MQAALVCGPKVGAQRPTVAFGAKAKQVRHCPDGLFLCAMQRGGRGVNEWALAQALQPQE